MRFGRERKLVLACPSGELLRCRVRSSRPEHRLAADLECGPEHPETAASSSLTSCVQMALRSPMRTNGMLALRRIHTLLPQLSDFGGGLITLGLRVLVFRDELRGDDDRVR